MKKAWVIFFHNNRELLRYSLAGETEGERESTIELLAYENGLEPCEISFAVVVR